MRFLKLAVVVFFAIACAGVMEGQSKANSINVTFTTIDVPGAVYTGIFGINSAGYMVGNYGQDTNQDSHGFMYSNGAFTYFDYPGETVTFPSGINDSNLIVGYAGTAPFFGFTYDGTAFTTITDGNDNATATLGINNNGEIVGGAGTIYTTTAFALMNGKFKTLPVPGIYTYIYANAVNNLGNIVGWTDYDGFLCRGRICKVIDYPGAGQTEVLGINDAGLLVGWYSSSTCTCAFVSKNGKFLSFNFPGAAATTAAGVNRSGQIVGQYTFDYNAWHGFVTNPITDVDFR